jgi:4-amino-4-deoxy-L-arabinose transferase-like glycosyltransferase
MAVIFPLANDRAPMLRVSLIVEALRAHPALMVAVAALAQGTLWTLVPALFYAAPPGDVPLVLAVGREWLTGSPYGPPLAYWLAETAFDLAGGRIVGVYLLSQLCVVATYWAVFALGRRIVGAAHAAIAVLLMAGISAFTVPTIEFGPSVPAMPLSALAPLFAYRALADNKHLDWLALGAALGLLVLTTSAGLILLALIVAFIGASARGRSRLGAIGPWAAAVLIVLINFSQFIWLERSGINPLATLAALPGAISAQARPAIWFDLVLRLIVSHAGLLVLLFVAGGLFAGRHAGAPAFERPPVERFGRVFVYVFALAPAFVATLLAALLGSPAPIGGAAPLAVLSSLAIVAAAGDTIRLYRERTGALVWLGLLVVPPTMIVAATVTLPWTAAIDLEVSKPAAAMGEFFTDTFRRRTGRRLATVVGDVRSAGLVAFTSPDRPSLYIDGSPVRAPWVSDDAVRRNGAVVLWTATDAAGAPPAHLKARFPDMVAEVPRAFPRSVQGRLPLLRIGWAVIRPAQ